MSFYVTLPSDSSMEYFPNNTISHFVTHLPRPIELTGEWEVGVSEFSFPHTFYNINETNNTYVYDLGDGRIYDGEITPGYYNSVKAILNAIRIDAFQDLIEFSFNPVCNCVRISVNHGAKFMFKDGLAQIMGFYPKFISQPTIPSEFPHNVYGPFPADPCGDYRVMMLYTDIIRDQIVGNILAPLLRIINVKGDHNEMVLVQFDRPHYLPVVRKNINSLEMVIRTHAGNLVPFERGRSYVKLHFRQKYLS